MYNADYSNEYDKSDPLSIEKFSQKLIGKTFRQVINEDENYVSMAEEPEAEYGTSAVSETKRNKGNLGQIIEERFFHYACNSDSRADFYEAGVELKVTPYKINKNGKRGQDAGKPVDTFKLIEDVISSSPVQFTHIDVLNRAKRMAEYAVKIWNSD